MRIGYRLVVMELELIEPMLYFDLARFGARQLVDATVSKVKRTHK